MERTVRNILSRREAWLLFRFLRKQCTWRTARDPLARPCIGPLLFTLNTTSYSSGMDGLNYNFIFKAFEVGSLKTWFVQLVHTTSPPIGSTTN
jgi:hypothetical protein